MAIKKYYCDNSDCYANSLKGECLLKKRKIFGMCRDYYPKVETNGADVFSHLFHKHNLATRNLSTIAIIISIFSILFATYTTTQTISDMKPIGNSLENMTRAVVDIRNHLDNNANSKFIETNQSKNTTCKNEN